MMSESARNEHGKAWVELWADKAQLQVIAGKDLMVDGTNPLSVNGI